MGKRTISAAASIRRLQARGLSTVGGICQRKRWLHFDVEALAWKRTNIHFGPQASGWERLRGPHCSARFSAANVPMKIAAGVGLRRTEEDEESTAIFSPFHKS